MAKSWKDVLDDFSGKSAKDSSPVSAISQSFSSPRSSSNNFRSTLDNFSGLSSRKVTNDDAIAPIAGKARSDIQSRMTVGKKKDEEEERTWIKKGNDSISKTILGTGTDVLEDLTAGIVGMGEKAVDAVAMVAPYVANSQFYQNGVFDLETEKAHKKAIEDSKKEIGAFVAKDLYDEGAVARKILSGFGSASYLDSKIQNGGYLTDEDLKFAQELNKPVLDYLENDMEKDSVLGEKSDALVQSAGQLAGQFGLSMVGVPWFVTSGMTSFGAESENALKNGASYEEATGSAAISAGAEIISEKLFGGDLFVGKSGSDLATKYLSANIANKAWRNFVKWSGDTVGEGFEEVFSQFVSNLGSSLYREENLGEILFSEQALDEYIESFWGGVALGGVMGGINVAKSNAAGVDFTSGLTANEQKVVQKELENRLAEKEGKVTSRQKAKIWGEVVSDMDKGRISIETIEEVLGGEAYEKYNAAMNNQKDNDFLNSYEELRKKTGATAEDVLKLSEMKPMYKSITDYRNQTKAELTSKVSEFVRGDRLSESYRESDRRFQKFEADLTQYDEKQRELVQKAIDSGVLNNTNRSHEFVDILAKIHAEKGVPFDFTNNKKLKESGFAIEGATVDGFVNENGITINMESPKAWQTTVGHEITHVLEGTEFYSELQKVLFEYAESKGHYKTLYDTLAERYKNVYKDISPEEYEAKINAEVTADLIGEYLFTDESFVNNLSANKNVFQKIYDEIKYLCKVATAGSKEARELEKVKRAFEKAYREGGKTQGDTKYSISDSDGKELSKGQQEFFKDSQARDEEGNLVRVYHTSPTAGFTVMDGSEGEGNYKYRAYGGGVAFFTDNKRMSSSYAPSAETIDTKKLATVEDARDWVQDFSGGYIEIRKSGSGYKVTYSDSNFEILSYRSERALLRDLKQDLNAEIVSRKRSGQYEGYTNITKPYVIDAKGSVWNAIPVVVSSSEVSVRTFGDRLKTLSSEEVEFLKKIHKDALLKAKQENGDALENFLYSLLFDDNSFRASIWDKTFQRENTALRKQQYQYLFDVVGNNFSTEGIPTEVVEEKTELHTTNQIAMKALESGIYDGVIIKNTVDYGEFGLSDSEKENYSDLKPGNLYITFNSNQFKAADNLNPTHDPDIRYSLSDSEGKQLTKGQQEYFKDSQARDEEGSLVRVYHTSPTAGFTIFEGSKGTGNYKFGKYSGGVTYFTDNKAMSSSYAPSVEELDMTKLDSLDDANNWLRDRSGGFFEVRKVGENYIVFDTDDGEIVPGISYTSERELLRNLKRDIQMEYGDPEAGGIYEGYTNIKNPYVVDARDSQWNRIKNTEEKTYSMDNFRDTVKQLSSEEKEYLDSKYKQALLEEEYSGKAAFDNFKDLLDLLKYNSSENNKSFGVSVWETLFSDKEADQYEYQTRYLFDVIKNGFSTEGISTEYTTTENVITSTNGIVEMVLNMNAQGKSSYDGVIIKNVFDYGGFSVKHFGESEKKSGNLYITFDADQFKHVNNLNPTHDPDMRYSLSDNATNPNGYATPASDLMYAPVSETENVAPVGETVAESNIAPIAENVTDAKHSVHPELDDNKPLTPSEKAQEHYRSGILNRGDILSKLVNTGKTTMKAINEATKQAQTLISKGVEGVKSISDIFEKISIDGKLGDFEDYLHHMLNVDRSTMMERFGLRDRPVWDYSAEESQKLADKLAEENPEFVKAAEDVYAFNDYVMSVRVKSGKITQEQADIWKQYYPHYVPISRGGADTYKSLLNFAEGDTTVFKTLDDFSKEADWAADVYKIKVKGDDIDPLMDTMVNAAFTAHWGLAISENAEVTAPTAPVQTEAQHTQKAPVTNTVVENQTEEDYVPSAEKAPSPDAVQAADYESIKLMEQPDGVKGKVLDAVHWVEDNVLDNGRVFEKIDHKKGNRNLYSHWHAIRNAFSSAQYFIGHGNESKGVRALNDIYAEIKKKGLTSDFDSYLAHQRNIDGMTMQARYGLADNRDFVKGVSAAQSYKEVQKLQTEHPQFKQWAKDIYANTGYVIDQMVEHKMLSQDMADLFKELYPHYVPVRHGKNGALESSLESLGQFTMEAFNSFAMNDFGLQLKHTLRSEINREDMNIDTFIERLDSGRSLFDFDVKGMDEDYHTFTVYEDGELKTFDITKEMYMAMNQTRNWMDWKIPVLYQVNEGFRKATTELNWIFAATNGVKDPQEIMWNSQHPLETYAKFLPAEAAVWSKDSKYRHYYEEYLANGGESFDYFNPNKNTFDADKGVLAYLNQKIGTGAISNLNGRIETAPRLAEYIASREAGKSVQEAMLDAAQVTVNFQAGGKLTKFLNRNGCTFLNASVQGALQHARNIQEGKQNAWKGVTALIAKGMVAGLGSELVKQINHLLWDDDDEYENLPDYIKQDYYLFGKFGDGTWLRIPKGRTNATVEEAIRQVALSSTGDDEADWDNFWKLFIENMAPNNPITNNLLAPILEVKTNTTWYGEDLLTYRLKDLPVTEQYDEKTDIFSVWLGEKLDYSPKKINYLINSYTGVIGDTLLPMGTPKAESPDDGLLGKLIAPLKDKLTTDAVLNHRVTGDFYETLEAAEKQAESKNATMEDKFRSGMLIGYNVEISKLMQEQRDIQMSDMKNSEKYKKTREIKKEINALQEKALVALESYSMDGIYAEAGDKRYNYDSEKDTWWEVKPKTSEGKDNYYYIQEQLYHDKLGVDYADYWNGRLNPEDYDVKSLYGEYGDKRFNFDMEKNTWYEIKPKTKEGKDNSYYQREQTAHNEWGVSYEDFWNNREAYADAIYVAENGAEKGWGTPYYETVKSAIGLDTFTQIASDLADIKGDTRKRDMQKYIYSLDIPEIQKHILFKAEYPKTNTHSYEIVKYLDENDDISYDSFCKILDELGYKVDNKGHVTWW